MSTKKIQLTGFKAGSGVYIGSGDMPEDYNIQIDPEGDATELIEAPAKATVGQMLAVTEVDENGKPTKWEAVDKPLGINIGAASVGQVVIVNAVDSAGIPTEYEGMDVVDGNEALFYADGNEVAY